MASENEQAPLKTYRGNCHCGNFVYEVKLPEIKKVFQCDCSICFKKGYLWQFPATPDDFKFVKGDEKDMTEYKFGKGTLSHHFCPNCGVGLIGKRGSADKPGYGINVRGIQGPSGKAFDVWSLETVPFDGASFEPKYTQPPNTVADPNPSGEGKLYRGNCHCGKVTWACKFKDLTTLDSTNENSFSERIAECNCSMCQRGAYIWLYPTMENFALEGREHLSYYTFGNHIARKAFCKTCGVHVANEPNELSEEEVAKLSDFVRQFRERVLVIRPVNLRTMEDGECVRGLKTLKADGWGRIPGTYVDP